MFWMDNTHWTNSQFRICYRQPNMIITIFRYLETIQYWIVPRFDHSLPLGPQLISFFGWLFVTPVLLPTCLLLILLLCNAGRNLGRSRMWFSLRSIEICYVNVYRFPFKSRHLPSSSKKPDREMVYKLVCHSNECGLRIFDKCVGLLITYRDFAYDIRHSPRIRVTISSV